MDIQTLTKQFETFEELLSYSNAQYAVIQKNNETIAKLQEENRHLKDLLTKTLPLIEDKKVDIIPKSTEQVICEMEIEKLKQTSMERNLTLEETKRFDLLVKNLQLAKKAISEEKEDLNKISLTLNEAQLMEIVKKPE